VVGDGDEEVSGDLGLVTGAGVEVMKVMKVMEVTEGMKVRGAMEVMDGNGDRQREMDGLEMCGMG
jgi:F0F1-type ATP synthase beta subunit